MAALITHQVAYEAQIGYREKRSEDVEEHAVQRCHINHHKVHVDCTNHQDDDAPGNLPEPKEAGRHLFSH